jgi:hypothetical protein
MTRYWFKFDLSNYENPPGGVRLGCGITAVSPDQAMFILKEKVFKNRILPPVLEYIPNVDVSTLDQNHITPNMLPPVRPGVWFPMGYE